MQLDKIIMIMKENPQRLMQILSCDISPNLNDADATHNWPDEERWSEAEAFSVQKQQPAAQGNSL